jgi:cysteine desulfurase
MSKDKEDALIKKKSPIYLDYNATTPIDPKVLDEMLPFLRENFGNPSSSHIYGQTAKKAVEKARQQVASLLKTKPTEIVFTSGGSESNNHAIIGTSLTNTKKGQHIITSQIEHPSVIETLQYLKKMHEFKITYLPVNKHGLVNPLDVEQAITNKTILITIMQANNEVGTIQPIKKIGLIAKEKGIVFHTDAAQSCGKIDVNINNLNVDLLTIAGHKIYAPKGIGALYIRSGIKVSKFIHGPGQENGRRAGTENVPYIVGLGRACEIASTLIQDYGRNLKILRDKLHMNIVIGLGKDVVKLNGHPTKRLPNTVNLSFKDNIGWKLLEQMPEIAASTGSACHAGLNKPSKVLRAMGAPRSQALGSLRFSLGRWSTKEQVNEASQLIIRAVQ